MANPHARKKEVIRDRDALLRRAVSGPILDDDEPVSRNVWDQVRAEAWKLWLEDVSQRPIRAGIMPDGARRYDDDQPLSALAAEDTDLAERCGQLIEHQERMLTGPNPGRAWWPVKWEAGSWSFDRDQILHGRPLIKQSGTAVRRDFPNVTEDQLKEDNDV
jgi:hypothetical protein